MKLYGINYQFPQVVVDRVADKFPLAGSDNLAIAFQGFLDYVDICKEYPEAEIPMFSQSVDEVWHQFLMDTRSYAKFCEEYVGFFLHHVPNGKDSKFDMRDERKKLKMLWLLACKQKGLDVLSRNSKPALFTADVVLNVPFAIDYLTVQEEVVQDIRWAQKTNQGKKPSSIEAIKNFFGSKPKEKAVTSEQMTYDYWVNDWILLNGVSSWQVSASAYDMQIEKLIKQNHSHLDRADDSCSNQSHTSNSTHHTDSSHYSSPSDTGSSSNSNSSSSRNSDSYNHSSSSKHSCSSSSHSSHHSCSSSSSSHSSCSSSSSSCSSSSCSS